MFALLEAYEICYKTQMTLPQIAFLIASNFVIHPQILIFFGV